MITKTYLELSRIESFLERFRYLKIDGYIGEETFGSKRYLNQILYSSKEWHDTRRKVILRDEACDLGHPDYQIPGSVYVHHLNPITVDDILDRRPCVFDLNNLVCVSFKTHNAIHFGDERSLPDIPIVRLPNDTCPWKCVNK